MIALALSVCSTLALRFCSTSAKAVLVLAFDGLEIWGERRRG